VFERDDFLPLRDFLGRLPGVKPRLAFDLLREAWLEAATELEPQQRISTIHADLDKLKACFTSNSRQQDCVSPEGATWLLDAYKAGQLPMSLKRPKEIPEELLDYAAGKGTLLEKAREERLARQAREAQQREWIEDPSKIPEAEFSYWLLNQVFFRHRGAGDAQMIVGGVLVEKTVHPYRSNSGKSVDFEVTYSWRATDGTPKVLRKPSTFEGNRRNDAARNWGLGRE